MTIRCDCHDKPHEIAFREAFRRTRGWVKALQKIGGHGNLVRYYNQPLASALMERSKAPTERAWKNLMTNVENQVWP